MKTSIFLFIWGLLLAQVGIFTTLKTATFVENAVLIDGTVTNKINQESPYSSQLIDFTHNGIMYSLPSRLKTKEPLPHGEKVQAYFSPKYPIFVIINDNYRLWGVGLMLALLGFSFLTLGIMKFNRMKRFMNIKEIGMKVMVTTTRVKHLISQGKYDFFAVEAKWIHPETNEEKLSYGQIKVQRPINPPSEGDEFEAYVDLKSPSYIAFDPIVYNWNNEEQEDAA